MPIGRGYNTAADVQLRTVDGRDYNAVWDEFQAALDAYQATREPLVNLLTFPVTTLVEDVVQGGQITLERLSEFGIAQSARATGTITSFGYDLNYYGKRLAYTERFLSSASDGEIETLHSLVLDADKATTYRLMWQAIFSNVNRTAVIDGNPTIYPVFALYNADGTVPPTVGSKRFDGTHNHYVVSQGSSIDSGDVEAAITNVEEHGATPASGATIVVIAPTALVNSIRTWRVNVANANGAVALYDFVPAANTQPGILLNQSLVNGQPSNLFRGLPVAGQYGDAIIIPSDEIPAGYFLTFATGGAQAASNVVGFREHSNPAYQGLRLINGQRVGYPLIDSHYEHSMGTGIRQRGNAVVTQIKASGSYDVPSFTGGFE